MVGVSSPSLPDNKNTQPYLHISSKLTHGMNAPCAGLRCRWRRAKQAVTATTHELRLQHVTLPSVCRSALSHSHRRFYPIGARPQRGPTLRPRSCQGSVIRLDEAVAAHTALMPNHQADATCEILSRQSTVIRASSPSRPFESAIRVSLRAAKSAIRRIRESFRGPESLAGSFQADRPTRRGPAGAGRAEGARPGQRPDRPGRRAAATRLALAPLQAGTTRRGGRLGWGRPPVPRHGRPWPARVWPIRVLIRIVGHADPGPDPRHRSTPLSL